MAKLLSENTITKEYGSYKIITEQFTAPSNSQYYTERLVSIIHLGEKEKTVGASTEWNNEGNLEYSANYYGIFEKYERLGYSEVIDLDAGIEFVIEKSEKDFQEYYTNILENEVTNDS